MKTPFEPDYRKLRNLELNLNKGLERVIKLPYANARNQSSSMIGSFLKYSSSLVLGIALATGIAYQYKPKEFREAVQKVAELYESTIDQFKKEFK